MYSVFYLQDDALYRACERGDVVGAQELMSQGANVNNHNNYVSDSAHTHPSTSVCACTHCVSIQCILVLQAQ